MVPPKETGAKYKKSIFKLPTGLCLETIIIAISERATLYFVSVVDMKNSRGNILHIRFDPTKHTQQEVLDTPDFQIEALASIVLPRHEKVTVGFEYQYRESNQGKLVSKLLVTEIIKVVITDEEIQTCFPLMNTTGPRAIVLKVCTGDKECQSILHSGLPSFLNQNYIQPRLGMEVCSLPLGEMYQLQSQLSIQNPLKILDEILASHEDTARTRTGRQRRASLQEVPWMGSSIPKKPSLRPPVMDVPVNPVQPEMFKEYTLTQESKLLLLIGTSKITIIPSRVYTHLLAEVYTKESPHANRACKMHICTIGCQCSSSSSLSHRGQSSWEWNLSSK